MKRKRKIYYVKRKSEINHNLICGNCFSKWIFPRKMISNEYDVAEETRHNLELFLNQ